MDKLAVHFSSTSDEWATPQHVFDECLEDYPMTLDVCATPENAKCSRYFTREQDGLAQEWTGVCWMNPPYGRGIGDWVAKASRSAERDATVVCLLPARTDTKWFQRFVYPVLRGERPGKVLFLPGRLKFGNAKNSAPFPSLIVVFEPLHYVPFG